MTKEPLPTTHNAERGARSTCREKLKTGSSPKRTKKKCYSPIKECFRYMENMLCDLEKSSLAIWKKNVVGV